MDVMHDSLLVVHHHCMNAEVGNMTHVQSSLDQLVAARDELPAYIWKAQSDRRDLMSTSPEEKENKEARIE